MKQYLIDENVLQGIVSYLATRPWAEVKDAMPVLTSLKEHTELTPENIRHP